MPEPDGARLAPACRRGRLPDVKVIAVRGPIGRADIDGLCARISREVGARAGTVLLCDVRGIDTPDAVAVDALARMQLTARRSGAMIHLVNECVELRALLKLTGLSVALREGLTLERQREAEQREEFLGVEEERDPADPSV